jgi:phosphopantothenoylcysteine decarboxylase/phosphopantothenate--cysteine ligase
MAPAMNTNMWEHDAVRANVARLEARGVTFVDPGSGYLACGWVGPGRLAEPEAIAEAADARLSRGRPSASLAGMRVLVTAGPTFEDLDPVRFIGNRSSGRMGFAVAAEARARGAHVTLVAGPTTVEPPAVDDLVRVRSAAEMHAAVIARVDFSDRADRVDVVVMAAAVADYAPASGAASGKIDKAGSMTVTLNQTRDILADLGARRGDASRPVLVGFAAQTGDPVPAGRRKLVAKHVDLIVANDVSRAGSGFDVATNQVTFISADGVEPLPLLSKVDVARQLLTRVEQRLLARPAAPAATR